MAFFTTLTLSSLSSMFRLAISLSSSSLSVLLHGSEPGQRPLQQRGETFRRLVNSPRLLDEADDKLPHFYGLVCLEGNYFLQNKNKSTETSPIKELNICLLPYIQEIVEKRRIFVEDELLDLKLQYLQRNITFSFS